MLRGVHGHDHREREVAFRPGLGRGATQQGHQDQEDQGTLFFPFSLQTVAREIDPRIKRELNGG